MEDTFYVGGYFSNIREVHQLLAAEGRKRGRGVFVFDFTPSDLDSKPYFGGIGFRTLNVFTQNGHLTGRSEATTPCPHFCTPASIEQSNIIMDSKQAVRYSRSLCRDVQKIREVGRRRNNFIQ